VSNIRLKNSILTTEMQSKIKNGDSQLTSAVKEIEKPAQLSLDL